MRMTPHQLLRHVIDDIVDVESDGFARDLGVHHDQQQEVTEFLAKMRVVLGAGGSATSVSFFNRRWQKRFVRLLPVPRTAARLAVASQQCRKACLKVEG